jgi:hypothetical protein
MSETKEDGQPTDENGSDHTSVEDDTEKSSSPDEGSRDAEESEGSNQSKDNPETSKPLDPSSEGRKQPRTQEISSASDRDPTEGPTNSKSRGFSAKKAAAGVLLLSGWTVGFVAAAFWLFSIERVGLEIDQAPLRDRVLAWVLTEKGPEVQLLSRDDEGKLLGDLSDKIPGQSERQENSTVREERAWYEQGETQPRGQFDVLGSRMRIGMTHEWKPTQALPVIRWVAFNPLGWKIFSFGIAADFLYAGKSQIDQSGAFLSNVHLDLVNISRFKLGHRVSISGQSETFAVPHPKYSEESVAVFRLDLMAKNPVFYLGPRSHQQRLEIAIWGSGRMIVRALKD